MDISIDRAARHVTLSMPGYVEKLLRKVSPEGVKSASTPSIYHAPNYKSPQAQTATHDASPLASDLQQHELQVIVGTLLLLCKSS